MKDLDQVIRRDLRHSPNKLKLGLFGINASGGMSMTAAPRSYVATWEHSSAIAKRAEEIGFEFLVPVARWRGMGGSTDWHGESFETFTWAAGIAAETSEITVTATAHVPVIHPTYAAKAAATIDHISNGRVALNAVMGWFTPELAQFGIEPEEHDIRYEHGQEWIQLVQRLWTDEDPVSHEGRWFSVRDARLRPQPKEAPVLFNAGTSPSGIEFTIRNCDFNLGSASTLKDAKALVGRVKRGAREKYDRDVGVLNIAFVLCDDSQVAAERRYREILDNGDWEGAKNMLHFVGLNVQSYADPTIRGFQEQMITSGSAYNLVGTPEKIADELAALSAAGVDGLALGFLDYYPELQQFEELLLPLLEREGLRQ
jgi:FMNH2-dependent dimethyl sulfone monooxygenase